MGKGLSSNPSFEGPDPCSLSLVSAMENVPIWGHCGFSCSSDAEEYEIGLRYASPVFLQFYIFFLFWCPQTIQDIKKPVPTQKHCRETLSLKFCYHTMILSLITAVWGDHHSKCGRSWALESVQKKTKEDRPRRYTAFTKYPLNENFFLKIPNVKPGYATGFRHSNLKKK